MDDPKLDDATKKELTQFLEQEHAHARVQETIHKLTSMCWDKCITGTPSMQFSRGEESCLSYCVDRFLDTSFRMVQHIQEQRNAATASTN